MTHTTAETLAVCSTTELGRTQTTPSQLDSRGARMDLDVVADQSSVVTYSRQSQDTGQETCTAFIQTTVTWRGNNMRSTKTAALATSDVIVTLLTDTAA